MSDHKDSDFPYKPNHAAPIAFAVLFGLTLLAHIWQAASTRALFMLALIIATLLQVLGYITRYIAIINDPQLWSFVVSQVAIVVAPSFLSASEYMFVGRMMAYVGPESTIIPHNIITKLFVAIDVVCVLTQAAGAGSLSSNGSKDSVMRGRAILIGGLIIQVASFSVFVIVAVLFDFKARAVKGDQLKQLRPLFIAFYASAGLVIGRSIYRTIEFATINFNNADAQGYLYNNEWPFYVLDAIPIIIATAVFNFVNPSSYLPRKKGLRMDGTIEPERKHWWSSVPKETNAHHSEDYLMTRA